MSCKVFSTFLFSTEDMSADSKPDVVNADSKGSEEEGENSEDWRHGGMREIFRVCVAFYRPRGYQSHFQGLIRVPRCCQMWDNQAI